MLPEPPESMNVYPLVDAKAAALHTHRRRGSRQRRGQDRPRQEPNCGKAVRMPVRLTDAPKRSPFNASYPTTVENVTPIKKRRAGGGGGAGGSDGFLFDLEPSG